MGTEQRKFSPKLGAGKPFFKCIGGGAKLRIPTAVNRQNLDIIGFADEVMSERQPVLVVGDAFDN